MARSPYFIIKLRKIFNCPIYLFLSNITVHIVIGIPFSSHEYLIIKLYDLVSKLLSYPKFSKDISDSISSDAAILLEGVGLVSVTVCPLGGTDFTFNLRVNRYDITDYYHSQPRYE